MSPELELQFLKDVLKTTLLPVYKQYCWEHNLTPELDLDFLWEKKKVAALLSGSFGVSSDRREPRNKTTAYPLTA